jgi:allophanate hydrolase
LVLWALLLVILAIPPPLATGTLTLADATPVKSLLCEAKLLREAQDISHHGGRRAYVAAEKRTNG